MGQLLVTLIVSPDRGCGHLLGLVGGSVDGDENGAEAVSRREPSAATPERKRKPNGA